MKATLLGALFLLTAACGSYQFPTSPPLHNGTVYGRVVVFPCGPMQPAGIACVGRPAAGLEIDFVNGRDLYRAVTDLNGNYSIELGPATYQVQFKSYRRIVRGPTSVTVTAGAGIVADYVLDSGLRDPAPQQ